MPYNIIQNLSHTSRKNNLLQKIVNNILNEFGLYPVIGTEIEFYINNNVQNIENIFSTFPYSIKPEKGRNQFEIDILPQKTLALTLQEITKAKSFLLKHPNVTLHPKPYSDDYGSAMHFHINFIDEVGNNIFDNTKYLEDAAKSLCHFLTPSFLIFAPQEHHYSRFDHKYMAPTRVCFGPNNRTVAIRIPDATPKRIEHRLSSPESDEYLAICSILQTIYLGLKNPHKIPHHPKVYGNAFDDQYSLPFLPQNIFEAARVFDEKLLLNFEINHCPY